MPGAAHALLDEPQQAELGGGAGGRSSAGGAQQERYSPRRARGVCGGGAMDLSPGGGMDPFACGGGGGFGTFARGGATGRARLPMAARPLGGHPGGRFALCAAGRCVVLCAVLWCCGCWWVCRGGRRDVGCDGETIEYRGGKSSVTSHECGWSSIDMAYRACGCGILAYIRRFCVLVCVCGWGGCVMCHVCYLRATVHSVFVVC